MLVRRICEWAQETQAPSGVAMKQFNISVCMMILWRVYACIYLCTRVCDYVCVFMCVCSRKNLRAPSGATPQQIIRSYY